MSKSPAQHIPPPDQCQFWIDFDGTISTKDVLDELIQQYAFDESWLQIEQLWQEGKIGSYECLKAEFDIVRINEYELDEFLDTIGVDPGITELLALLKKHNVPATIVSDGIDLFIKRILGRHGIHTLPIRSNTLTRSGDQISLVCPLRSAGCLANAAHCKCSSMVTLSQPGRKGIYIGDGRSDLCPSSRHEMSEVVFAKKALARSLVMRHVPFIAYETLHDVCKSLRRAWHDPKSHE